MYRRNATGQWLAELESDKKEATVKAAIQEARQIEQQDKAAQLELRRLLNERLLASRKELQVKDDKLRARNETFFEKVFEYGGLWERRRDGAKPQRVGESQN